MDVAASTPFRPDGRPGPRSPLAVSGTAEDPLSSGRLCPPPWEPAGWCPVRGALPVLGSPSPPGPCYSPAPGLSEDRP